MGANNVNTTNYAQDTDRISTSWDGGDAASKVEARVDTASANTEAVLEANQEVADAQAEANTQNQIEDAQTTQQVGQGMQTAGTILTTAGTLGAATPGFGAVCSIAGAVLNIAGAATTQGGAIAESDATNDASKAIASSENLATTTDKGVKDIKTATAETTLVEGETVQA